MEFEGAKGKWICYRRTDQHKISEILTEDRVSICAIPTNIEESEANAKLIAAAPEMFEMLKELKDWIFNEQGYCTKYFEIEQLLTKITEL